jgi:branched-subunit amino acid aminotransferase/4-amino-4-deoxychorismate lyase
LSSNFYAVNQNVVWTAKDRILHGITREIVLDVIREKQIQVESRGYPFNNIYKLDEAFITSTSRGVLAVTSINDQKIGNGQPGPMTGIIQKAYEEKISRLIEEI